MPLPFINPGTPGPQGAPQQQQGPLSDVDPELLRALIDRYGMSEEEAATMVRYKRAQALSGTGMPQLRQVRDNIAVAPHPLEYAAAAYRQYLGAKGERDVEARLKALGKMRGRQRGAAAEMFGAPPLTDPDAVPPGDENY